MVKTKAIIDNIIDYTVMGTGVDLSKYWVGKPKYGRGQKVVKSDKCMGVSQLMGAHSRAAPKVYAYV